MAIILSCKDIFTLILSHVLYFSFNFMWCRNNSYNPVGCNCNYLKLSEMLCSLVLLFPGREI